MPAEHGSDEWIKSMAQEAAKAAQPQLVEVATSAYHRHHGDQIRVSQIDMARLAMILAETQDQSFMVGVQMGMKLVIETSKEA
jgi:hypothetical protein